MGWDLGFLLWIHRVSCVTNEIVSKSELSSKTKAFNHRRRYHKFFCFTYNMPSPTRLTLALPSFFLALLHAVVCTRRNSRPPSHSLTFDKVLDSNPNIHSLTCRHPWARWPKREVRAWPPSGVCVCLNIHQVILVNSICSMIKYFQATK